MEASKGNTSWGTDVLLERSTSPRLRLPTEAAAIGDARRRALQLEKRPVCDNSAAKLSPVDSTSVAAQHSWPKLSLLCGEPNHEKVAEAALKTLATLLAASPEPLSLQ